MVSAVGTVAGQVAAEVPRQDVIPEEEPAGLVVVDDEHPLPATRRPGRPLPVHSVVAFDGAVALEPGAGAGG